MVPEYGGRSFSERSLKKEADGGLVGGFAGGRVSAMRACLGRMHDGVEEWDAPAGPTSLLNA